MAAGVRTIGEKSSAKAKRRPGIRALPQNRNPSRVPNNVVSATLAMRNPNVVLNADQTSTLSRKSR